MGRKLTQIEVIQRFKKKLWKLIDQYQNENIRVKAICPYCNKIVLVMPRIIFRGQQSCGCMSKKLLWDKKHKILQKNKLTLGHLHPELIKLYSKNNKISIFEIHSNSKIKRLWICEKYGYDHEYEMTPNNTILGQKCPYCAGKKVLVGFNDLATTHPEIAKEWHPTKNEDLKPTNFTRGSHQKMWWFCIKCNNSWYVSINNRTSNNTKCPHCYIRSKIEEKITKLLQENYILFIRQKKFDTCKNKRCLPFDFYLPNYNLLVEYHGEQHYKHTRYSDNEKLLQDLQYNDKIKEQWAKDNHIPLLIISYKNRNKIETTLKQYIDIKNQK